jgi:hypothetical protein
MPEIIRFSDGLEIHIYIPDHNKPHIHAVKNSDSGSFDIDTGIMTDGNLPKKYHKEVKEFISKYSKELLKVWNTKHLNKGDFRA